jgi:hypothetical protein
MSLFAWAKIWLIWLVFYERKTPLRACLERRNTKQRKGKKNTEIGYRCSEKTEEWKNTGTM